MVTMSFLSFVGAQPEIVTSEAVAEAPAEEKAEEAPAAEEAADTAEVKPEQKPVPEEGGADHAAS